MRHGPRPSRASTFRRSRSPSPDENSCPNLGRVHRRFPIDGAVGSTLRCHRGSGVSFLGARTRFVLDSIARSWSRNVPAPGPCALVWSSGQAEECPAFAGTVTPRGVGRSPTESEVHGVNHIERPTRTDLHDKDEGFSIHEHVFDHVEMLDALDELAHAPMARTKAGARHVLLVPMVLTAGNRPPARRDRRDVAWAALPFPFGQPCSTSHQRRTGSWRGIRTRRYRSPLVSRIVSGAHGR